MWRTVRLKPSNVLPKKPRCRRTIGLPHSPWENNKSKPARGTRFLQSWTDNPISQTPRWTFCCWTIATKGLASVRHARCFEVPAGHQHTGLPFIGTGHSQRRVQQLPDGHITTSAINLFELAFGAVRSNNAAKLRLFITKLTQRYAVISFDRAAGVHTKQTRAALQATSTLIGPCDVQVASTALANNFTVITRDTRNTRNTREFVPVPRLKLENWHNAPAI